VSDQQRRVDAHQQLRAFSSLPANQTGCVVPERNNKTGDFYLFTYNNSANSQSQSCFVTKKTFLFWTIQRSVSQNVKILEWFKLTDGQSTQIRQTT